MLFIVYYTDVWLLGQAPSPGPGVGPGLMVARSSARRAGKAANSGASGFAAGCFLHRRGARREKRVKILGASLRLGSGTGGPDLSKWRPTEARGRAWSQDMSASLAETQGRPDDRGAGGQDRLTARGRSRVSGPPPARLRPRRNFRLTRGAQPGYSPFCTLFFRANDDTPGR